LLLSGCVTEQPQKYVVADPAVDLTELSATAADAKLKAEHERELAEKQRQRVAANLDTADTANRGNPDGAPKATTADAIRLAKANNGDAKPDPEQLLIGERIARANAEGKSEEARRLVTDATGAAQAANAELAAVTARAKASQDALKAIIEAKGKELADLKAKAKQDLTDIIAAYDKKLDEVRSENIREQQTWLNRGAVALASLAAILVVAGLFIGSLSRLAAAAGFCMLCSCIAFGLSQIVGESWYKWAVIGAIVLIILFFIAMSWAHAERKEQAKVAEVLVPKLDQAKANASKEEQATLDALVFDPLSSKQAGMAAKVKATVHRIRATQKEKSST
jgi:TM2 domain-containing membrane protein YozV